MSLDNYRIIALEDLLSCENGEDIFHEAAQNFSCPLNEDVEHFLKQTALTNQRMGISRTSLIYTNDKPEPLLLGYYSLALQVLDLSNISSKTMRKKMGLNIFLWDSNLVEFIN